ncbi:hypothetical protein FIBSPDRAFT_862936 [Athelia psychrophila]|uniref:Uncharacterized protein n=1 Tax=Athelia psychrophila TaxID=1759441 RepID=A0A166HVJ8_9AGAM|nr:hypothetical protein FIBSPDRAFT_862936 [Fibularhizoctonia sp. CBS 109695]
MPNYDLPDHQLLFLTCYTGGDLSMKLVLFLIARLGTLGARMLSYLKEWTGEIVTGSQLPGNSKSKAPAMRRRKFVL